MTDSQISSQVYKSRDQIRNQIIILLKQYLDLENVDLTKSSFLSFIVEILSTLTSNLMFYQMSSYKEFFLTKAQLPESIYNLSAFLGYSPKEATPAEVNVLFSIPFGFEDSNVVFTIPNLWKGTAEGGIIFSTYYITTINVTNNNSASVVVQEGNRIYNLPVTILEDSFLFILPLRQFLTQNQEFQISEDLQQYQFVDIDVPFDGQISSIVVEVRPPDTISYEQYTEISSLFLMTQTTKGYVLRRTDSGANIQFGNGLIGHQPEAGSTVRITLSLTNGSSGNVISNTITSGERIYNTNEAGVTEIVQYDITNTDPAFNGKDEESLEEIRSNAITNLTALNRIVTENDFINSDVIIEDSPIGQNSLPVLKRSDLKINEICLFSTIFFGEELVPTRNFYTEFEELFIPRGTVLLDNDIEYYTIFDIIIDPLNSSANYTYILYEVTQIPALVTNYGVVYDLFADNLVVTRDGLQATYQLHYKSTEVDFDTTVCKMTILETGAQYDMINDGTSFTLVFANNLVIPNGEITYYFTISHPVFGNLSQYSNRFIFRKDLEDFTISNVVIDSTSYIVYDIPTIKKSYYDSIDQRVFETQVLQTLLTTLTFKDYKMLTDFINFKFANTSGILNNMQLNSTSLDDVIDILSTPPLILENEDRFIVLNGTGVWENHDNEIATYLFDGTTEVWVFTEPSTEQMIYVQNEDLKYIYGDFGWIVPSYNIPLNITLDVFVLDNYTGSISNLIQSIKEELLDAFSTRFGINTNIYRSEIIDVVQSVEGVKHCRLLRPESSVFFNFNIDNFSQEELLQYSPEYVYFTEDTIRVRIV